ncbi:hypothetical protein DS2_02970 [Catenovulum agarivorans DS-2]|uniref:Transporter component n=1 Tax=Catenovulum agarivorans DS-2 TaxID=1328313 RepID=W7QIS2_9ALTE|nr:DUF6691 family protein [Catenovulum agarivorans]EWH11751.1 hypothetical protein DS2_02970 [Catenovulum agarivorans DS-2]
MSKIKSGLVGFISGVLFGAGLAVAQMTNPQKVLDFLNVTGDWDPSLALVMAGALVVSWAGYRVKARMQQPVYACDFSVPTNKQIDLRLMLGSATFGIGWGLAGLCPGPAIASLSYASFDLLIFVSAMLVGMLLAKVVIRTTS